MKRIHLFQRIYETIKTLPYFHPCSLGRWGFVWLCSDHWDVWGGYVISVLMELYRHEGWGVENIQFH